LSLPENWTRQEEDGYWIADISSLPGVMVYGSTTIDATSGVTKLAEKVFKEMQSCGEI